MRFSGLFTCHGGYSGCSASHLLAWRFRLWSIGSTTQYIRLRVIHLLYSFGSGPAGQLPNSDGYGCSSAGLCLLDQLRLLSKRSATWFGRLRMRFSGLFTCHGGYSGCSASHPLAWRFRLWSIGSTTQYRRLRVIHLLYSFGSGPAGQLPNSDGYGCSSAGLCLLEQLRLLSKRSDGSDCYGCGSAGYSPAMVATVAVLRVIYLLGDFGSGPSGQLPSTDGCGSYTCSTVSVAVLPVNYPIRTAMVAVQQAFACWSSYGCCPKGRLPGSDGYGCGSAGYSPAMLATVAVLRVIHLLGDFGSGPSGQLPSTGGCEISTCSTVSVAVQQVNYPISMAMVAV
ncbi:uncharacterized protein LOC100114467 isoform X1 [Nasonia vitripennis]|uniref:Uncharacterized protein n=1 Tax=Nasonia vitripennis TaxID=7425 RepID=A0A7M7QWA6_NASVI|nr:uncharacterized protein LOC100114467 isoform X1 [Nasonia vitripennis]XP_031785119.1 uncharacterized protein LOC100114467 isoform X1 [Nasonia vitripennis]XP_032455523.1 uncharacterized protein LOC100114467 isoform X1 [Nasonia vitripennis]XP_032455524.1 uncharacterized protein LOC100114467 isoform X1 [Nasonia vitripennis]XP_032455525.1 uncharacterized protein LOC100114467 isoform X1 [Nasonia vitripennis]XP_032455526.1 uncharacterized protein LOC100114467 isoform X1 [Nasonia vitripennis]XP_03